MHDSVLRSERDRHQCMYLDAVQAWGPDVRAAPTSCSTCDGMMPKFYVNASAMNANPHLADSVRLAMFAL